MSDSSALRTFFVQLQHDIIALGAVRAEGTLRDEAVRFELYSDEAPDAQPMHAVEVPAVLFPQLQSLILERSFFWPDADDDLWSMPANPAKRILVSPESGAGFMGDLWINRKAGQPATTVALTKIRPAPKQGLLRWMDCTDAQRAALEKTTTVSRGIALCNVGSRPHHLDGRALISALRPDALFVPLLDERLAEKVLDLATDGFVIVGVPGDEPLAMINAFLARYSDNRERHSAALQALELSFVHTRIRRVCTGCGRPTPVDQRTKMRIPEVLQPQLKDSYLFGRGCELCGHSAYRGTVGLVSMIRVDESFLHGMERNQSQTELARIAYEAGTRTLLEEGVRKITAGHSSFEEVLAVAPKIPEAFVRAITDAANKSAIKGDTKRIKVDRPAINGEQTKADPSRRPKQRLMIVEDDPDQRGVLEVVFATEGYEVITVTNGMEALEKLEQHTVDIIVCDVMMPVMNGAQLVREVRANPRLSALPVLMLTAVQNPEAEYTLLDSGADDYCEKNVKKKVLLKRVENLLSRIQRNPLQHLLDE